MIDPAIIQAKKTETKVPHRENRKRRRVDDGEQRRNNVVTLEQLRHSCRCALERHTAGSLHEAIAYYIENAPNREFLLTLGTSLGADVADWICVKCKNVNYYWRRNCNMRNCGAPREFRWPASQPQFYDPEPSHLGSYAAPSRRPYERPPPQRQRIQSYSRVGAQSYARPHLEPHYEPSRSPTHSTHSRHELQPGERYNLPGKNWRCPECENENYHFRDVCNIRKCGAKRPPLDYFCAECKQPNFFYRETCTACGTQRQDGSVLDS